MTAPASWAVPLIAGERMENFWTLYGVKTKVWIIWCENKSVKTKVWTLMGVGRISVGILCVVYGILATYLESMDRCGVVVFV